MLPLQTVDLSLSRLVDAQASVVDRSEGGNGPEYRWYYPLLNLLAVVLGAVPRRFGTAVGSFEDQRLSGT